MIRKRKHDEPELTMEWYPKNFESRIKKHWENLKEPVGEVMKQGMNMTVVEAADNMKLWKGTAKASVQPGGDHSLTQQYGSTGFKVGSYAISANIMEFGRAPNKKMPPVNVITDLYGLYDNDAFNVAAYIGKQGIQKTQPILKAKEKMFNRVNDMVVDAMNEVFERLGLE